MSEDLDEIWALYADDGAQSLDTVEAALLALRKEPLSHESVAELFRAMHTFKGNSRLLGLETIESCAHIAEDLVGLVRDEGATLDAELLEMLLEASDRLREMMEIAVNTRRDADKDISASIVGRMREKYARMRDSETGKTAGSVSEDGETGGDLPAEAEEQFETAVVFGAVTESLASDPTYLKIFLEIARDSLSAISAAAHSSTLHGEARVKAIFDAADILNNAATRIAIAEWPGLAAEFYGAASDQTRLMALLERAEYLYQRASGDDGEARAAPARTVATTMALEEAASTALTGSSDFAGSDGGAYYSDTQTLSPGEDDSFGAAAFLKDIAPHLDGLCDVMLASGETLNCDITPFCEPIQKIATRRGFIRIADTIAALPASLSDWRRFEDLFSEFHEDLCLIESSELGLDQSVGASKKAAGFLHSWYGNHMPATLAELTSALNMQLEEIDWERVVALQERLRRGCTYLGMDIASRVAVVLLDLSARVVSGEIPSDPVLLKVMVSFNSAIRALVLDRASGTEDGDAMQRLLSETVEVTEVLSGAAPVRSIEKLLRLPEGFRGVLTPESAKSAAEAFARGERFFIVRADTDPYPELTKWFFDWVNANGKMIGCITVPADKPIFDFLLTSRIEPEGVTAELLELDSTGECLRIMEVLGHACVEGAEGEGEEGSRGSRFDGGSGRSSASASQMLESIEEIVTGHGAIRDILASFEQKRFIAVIDQAMAVHGSWSKARDAVNRQLQDWQDDFEQLVQIETQLDKRLHQLQEDTVAARSRSASTLIQFLIEYAAGAAQRHARALRFTPFHQTDQIDLDLLEKLAEPLRALISISITHSIEPPAVRLGKCKPAEAEMRIGIARYLDRVVATIEDDGAGLDLATRSGSALRTVTESIQARGGEVEVGISKTGGVRFDVNLPLSMAVIGGMIVRAGPIMYVVPIHAIQRIVHSDLRDLIYLSADGRNIQLKLGADRIVPIRFLSESSETRSLILKGGETPADAKCLFVIAGSNSNQIALSIDEVVGEQLVIVRPMKGFLSAIRNVTGCALLSSGEIGMVLDMSRIVE
ncbi:Hpt domain-containing protein [Methylocystis echinoides]|uniref:histidine kinase n=1 Tax=Methylocystis echinoides TaxID=29468 RepID=A0A9W6GT88_9HYPH|nr:Hpt domain-containing protein [Methylocystis echinoides]GLI92461.1 chemotaxis protein CheA [Methylocystis echinoides]